MKTSLRLCCALLALLLAACGTVPEAAGTVPTGTGDSNPPEAYVLRLNPEDQNTTVQNSNSFVETDEGYYAVWSKETAIGPISLISFCPRGEDVFRPLCSKPNCRHEDEDCNAFCYGDFGYYADALYSIGTYSAGGLALVKRNMDGTDHVEVAQVDISKLHPDTGYIFRFHHGKLFVNCRASLYLPLEQQENHLLVIDLTDYTQSEPAADFLSKTSDFSFSQFYKDKLYCFAVPEKTIDFGVNDLKLVELDAVTGEARIPFSRNPGSIYATDSTLYFFEEDASYLSSILEVEIEQPEGPGFRELDLQSGAIKECGMPVEDALWAAYDEDFIYAGNYYFDEEDRTLYFLSRDYELVDQIDLKNGLNMAVAASDRIFFYDQNTGNINYYLDKSQIGSHALELIPVEMVG